jgi:Flp pilus assembly protein TadG
MPGKSVMKRFFKSEAGNMLALTAAGLMAVMGFAALAIDVGCMLTARKQVQNAVDSAALAGASGLLASTSTASDRAIYYAGRNDCLNQSVQISAADVTFPSSGRVRVQATRNMQPFFSQVFGIRQVAITANATAELGSLQGTKGLRPFCMPRSGWDVGEEVVVKRGSNGASGTPHSFFYCVDFPPVNQGNPEQGASNYRDNIRNGTEYNVSIGDVLQVEPGNMQGPTSQGVNDLIDADPGAYWDGHQVSGSNSGTASPRVIKVALYNPDNPPSNGRGEVTCIGLAAFFIDRMDGQDVVGRFIKTITTGDFGGGYSLLYKVKLIQ